VSTQKENVYEVIKTTEFVTEVSRQSEVEQQTPSASVGPTAAMISGKSPTGVSFKTPENKTFVGDNEETAELQKINVEDSWKRHVQLEDENVADVVPKIDAKMVEKSQLPVKACFMSYFFEIAFIIIVNISLSRCIFLVAYATNNKLFLRLMHVLAACALYNSLKHP